MRSSRELGDDGARLPALRKAMVLLVLVGCTFQVVQYLWGISYYRDEVALLVNVRDRPLGPLMFAPLDHAQAAPPLFLAALKGIGCTIGMGEDAMRLLPVLAGMAALALLAAAAWRLLEPFGAALATAMMATSDEVIRWSTQAKQYSMDMFIAAALIWLGTRASQDARPKQLAALSVASAVAVGFSHPAAFMVAAIWSVLLATSMIRRDPWSGARHLAAAAVPGAAFAAVWFWSLRAQSQNPYLHHFWNENFMPWGHPGRIPVWLGDRIYGAFSLVIRPNSMLGILLAPLLLLGAASWTWRGRWALLGFCAGPAVFTVLAAAVGKYPLGATRLCLFLVPGSTLLAGAGLDAACEWLEPRRRPAVAAVVAAIVVVPSLASATAHLVLPRIRSNLRPAIAHVREVRSAAEEPIYVGKHLGEVLWYWPEVRGRLLMANPGRGPSPDWFWEGVPGATTISGPDDLAGYPTIWFVAATKSNGRWEDEDLYKRLLVTHEQTDGFTTRGGVAALLRRRRE